MTGAKMRKLVDAIPPHLPEQYLERALGKIHNETARAQVASRIRRRDAAL